MKPVSSATGMNSPGLMAPSAACQRSSASKPATLPSRSRTRGWYTMENCCCCSASAIWPASCSQRRVRAGSQSLNATTGVLMLRLAAVIAISACCSSWPG
ncbi:hypothetical protein D3C78_1484440 [compost metagenome]